MSAAAIVALIVAVAAMGPDNRRRRHSLVLAVLLVVILGGVFSELLSRLGTPLFAASMLGFAATVGVAWALVPVVMRRAWMQSERGLELPVSERRRPSADQSCNAAGEHPQDARGGPAIQARGGGAASVCGDSS